MPGLSLRMKKNIAFKSICASQGFDLLIYHKIEMIWCHIYSEKQLKDI